MSYFSEPESLDESIEAALLPLAGERLGELLDLPAFLANERVEIEADGPYETEKGTSPYFNINIYIDCPLAVEDTDIAVEIASAVGIREEIEINGQTYLLHMGDVLCRHSEEFEEAIQNIYEGLSQLFNDEADPAINPETGLPLDPDALPPPPIWVGSDKTPEREDVLVVYVEDSENLDPALREEAAAIIAEAVGTMEIRPEIRYEGGLLELNIPPPKWTI